MLYVKQFGKFKSKTRPKFQENLFLKLNNIPYYFIYKI